jgi:glycosyltransferase involved in cell wall biosynthesis
MKPLNRVAFIGNHLPRRCGIATFTHDLHRAVATARTSLDTGVIAMTERGGSYDYPPAVTLQVRDDVVGDYVQAADFLNDAKFDVVSLQHEYGIFGGEAGGNIIQLLSRLEMPVLTTLHTVLPHPTSAQHAVMRRIIDISERLVVMAEKGRELLRSVHNVPDRKIELIPHGIPDFPYLDTHHAKTKLGFTGKTILLTFGLLSPNKGIETMLDAMPAIVKSCPDAVYVILGATHPNLLRDDGEGYRERLLARVRVLGLEDHVIFFNQFVDQSTLLDFISMCDLYVTPYLDEAQMTSGTLAYSFGLGKAVVSTPYWHAKELLGDGRGVLVPFGDADTMSAQIAGLLSNDVLRHSMRGRAYAASRSMTWAQTAKRYLASFEATQEAAAQVTMLRPAERHPPISRRLIPEVRMGHFLSLCDGTGILQHAVYSVADRSHGYCIDDNARALLLACALADAGEVPLPDELTSRFAAFIQHAWNSDTQRFRNFMSYDRRWLEPMGSEDSHGRTLWALGECSRKDTDPSRRRWAETLFKTALPAVEQFSSPRAWAFTLLGLDAYCALAGGDILANRIRGVLAERLMSMLSVRNPNGWFWFEDVLAYDNARLPQALIQTGLTTHTPPYVEAGLQSLRWLVSLQTAPSGCFRPVGTKSFGRLRTQPEAFDQQPVEAAATIAACLSAWRADCAPHWTAEAMRVFDWFLCKNDLQTPLIDIETGSCSDGLHPDRSNQNKGAESSLSYLLGLVDIRELDRSALSERSRPSPKPVPSTINRSIAPQRKPGGHVVSIPILEPPDLASAP